MGETELESMVVRLTGDGSSYEQMLRQAQDSSRAAAGNVQQYAGQIDGMSRQLQGFAQNATRALASLGASAWLRQSLSEFQNSELAALKLNAALESQGASVEQLNKRYDAFAEKMQEITTVEDDQVRSMLALAANQGLVGEKAERAVKNAIALASKLGDASGAQGYMRITAALEQGRVMTRVIDPALANIKDNTERVAAAQDRLAKTFKTAEAAAKSSSGAIKQLGVAYGNLLEDFGKVVADGLHPIVSTLRDVIKWVQALPPEFKEAVIVIAGLAAGILALGPIMAGLGLLFASVLNPVVIALGAAAVGAAVWSQSMGGVGKTFEFLKKQAYAAWDWLKPVRQALESLWGQIQQTASDVWAGVKRAAVDAWTGVFGSAKVNWDAVRDVVRDTIIAIEFGLHNWQAVVEVAWTAMRLGAVTAFEEVKYWLTDVVPAALLWFKDNWVHVLGGVSEWTVKVFDYLAKAVGLEFGGISWGTLWDAYRASLKFNVEMTVAAFAALPALLAGKVKINDLIFGEAKREALDLEKIIAGIPAFASGEFAKIKPFELPARQLSELEQYLRKLYDAEKGMLKESFEAFRAHKLEEFEAMGLLPEDGPKKGEEWGKGVGDAVTKGLDKGLEKFDAALFGSAEALSRIAEYKQRLLAPTGAPAVAHAGAPAWSGGGDDGDDDSDGDLGGPGGTTAGSGPAGGVGIVGKGGVRDILIQIRDILDAQAKKAGVTVQVGAGLGGV